MAGVFGNPINDEYLKGLPDYKDKPITPSDGAKEAMKRIGEEDKDEQALKFSSDVDPTPELWQRLVTPGRIYNASGGNISLVVVHDYAGKFVFPPPRQLANGQWGIFKHMSWWGDSDSAAVVYRVSSRCDWMFCWINSGSNTNMVYTEIAEVGHYANIDWSEVYRMMVGQGSATYEARGFGYTADVSIATGNPAYLTAKITMI